MTMTQLFTDRRNEQRYGMRKDAYAVLRRPEYRMGKILDISRSGMSFTYLSTNGRIEGQTYGLDLLDDKDGVFVGNLPFIPVSDFKVNGDEPFRKLSTRRQSIRFEDLSDSDLHALEAFIKKYGFKYLKEKKAVQV